MKSVLTLLVALPLAACSGAEEAPSPEPPRKMTESRKVSATVTVEDIDHAARAVTVRDSAGALRSFRVDDRVRGLDQVKAGDRIDMDYYEALAVEVIKPGEEADKDDVVIESAPPGERPAGTVARSVSTTATILAIDRSAPSITLQLADGGYARVRVRHPERLDQVKVGDHLKITYAEALAVSVRPAEKADVR